MKRLLKRICRSLPLIAALSLVPLVGGLSSCIEEQGACPVPDDSGEADEIRLTFRLEASGAGRTRMASRAEGNDEGGHPSIGSNNPTFDDFINERYFVYYIFAKPVEGTTWPMVAKMTNLTAAASDGVRIDKWGDTYEITASIPKATFSSITGIELGNNNKTLLIRVAAIVNSIADIPGLMKDVEDYDGFINAANTLIFNLNTDIYNNSEGDGVVTGIYKNEMPMFGVQTFSVNESELYYSDSYQATWLGDVDLLRSLAKIQVIDNIDNRNPNEGTQGYGYPRIKGVNLVCTSPIAYVLPHDAANFKGDVETPRIYNNAPVEINRTFKTGYLENLTSGAVRIGYLPEQAVTGVKAQITIAYDPSWDWEDAVYEVPLSGYDGVDFTATDRFGTNILRNHIYTISVNHINLGADLELNVHVIPWTESEYTLDYSQSVTVAEKMTLERGTYVDSDVDSEYGPNNGVVVLNPFTLPTYSPLKAKFRVLIPEGTFWHAELQDGIGDPNSFAFIQLKEDGTPALNDDGSYNVVDFVEGKGNAMSYLWITPRFDTAPQNNSAILQIYVVLADGSRQVVEYTDEAATYQNYTVFQNQTSTSN